MQRELAPVTGLRPSGPDSVPRPERHLTVVPEPRRTGRRVFSGERYALVAADLLTMATVALAAGAGWRTAALWTVPLVLAFAGAGLYRSRLRYSALDQAPAMLVGLGLVVATAVGVGGPAGLTRPGFTGGALAWMALSLVALMVTRSVCHRLLYWRRGRHIGLSTVVVGSGDVAVRLTEALRADRTVGLTPVGLVGPEPLLERELPLPVLGPVENLDRLVAAHRPGAVLVTYTGQSDADLVGSLRRFRRAGICLYVVPRLFELPTARAGAELVGGVPLVRLRPEPANRWRRAVKRLIDVTGAGLGLLALAPVLALCALAVRWESGRCGIVFRQTRVGLAGKPFTIMKFRSLTPASTVESAVQWSIANDDRVGPVGRVLRGTSLDELPQLLNVLRGDMSLVGPRPERPFFVDQFQRTYKGYGDRHRMPVGITGWAQIHGLRGDTSIEDRVRFDNYYVENWSLGLDLKILLRTVGSMLSIRRR